jgi:hypothetical protein
MASGLVLVIVNRSAVGEIQQHKADSLPKLGTWQAALTRCWRPLVFFDGGEGETVSNIRNSVAGCLATSSVAQNSIYTRMAGPASFRSGGPLP